MLPPEHGCIATPNCLFRVKQSTDPPPGRIVSSFLWCSMACVCNLVSGWLSAFSNTYFIKFTFFPFDSLRALITLACSRGHKQFKLLCLKGCMNPDFLVEKVQNDLANLDFPFWQTDKDNTCHTMEKQYRDSLLLHRPSGLKYFLQCCHVLDKFLLPCNMERSFSKGHFAALTIAI